MKLSLKTQRVAVSNELLSHISRSAKSAFDRPGIESADVLLTLSSSARADRRFGYRADASVGGASVVVEGHAESLFEAVTLGLVRAAQEFARNPRPSNGSSDRPMRMAS